MNNKQLIINGEIFKETSVKDYFITSYGKIYSLKSKKIIKPFVTKNGHLRIELKVNKKPHKFYIHRLVYESWVGKLNDGFVIEHLDSNPSNNYYKNLKQSTQKENIQTCIDAYRRKANKKYIILLNNKNNKYYKFNSIKEMLIFFDISGDSISRFKRATNKNVGFTIIDNNTLEGQSTIETIDFSEVKSNNGVEYFVGEIPMREVHGI